PVPATPVITQSGNTLTSSAPTGNQWYLNGGIITGATGQNYTATQNGNYTVIASANNCSSASSNSLFVTITGLNDLAEENISIYPNPASSQLFVATGSLLVTQINIYNAAGSLVKQITEPQSKSVDISELAEGAYIAEIKTIQASVIRRWIKINAEK
ncbi:MAG TPA: T9SS type A sorting domain-containing protein, partial [Chitinophagales bacterium]|nr:T9SS type A sorting domain-containing protein [Chitinophagales bacterium]